MQHLDEGTIHSWLDGELSGDEAARVEAHVKECPECAAAVAEARGFIAASSRILTALDNAPRGVIPAAAPIRRRNWAAWRAAAAVLVVAGGTLVVVRNTGRESQMPGPASEATSSNAAMPPAVDTRESIRTLDSTAPVTDQGSLSRKTAVGSSQQPNVRVPAPRAKKEAAADAMTATSQAAAPSPQVTDRSDARAGFRANVPAPERTAMSGRVGGVADEKLSTPSLAAAPTAVPPAQPLDMIRIRGASSLSAAIDSGPLKVVGNPRRIGAKITLYEVAPGDTVTLTEPLDLRLEAVVVTGIATAEPIAKQSAPRRAAVTEQREAAGTAGVDSQRSAANTIAPARAPSFPAPVTAVETADGVTTVSWTDATTGSPLKLSGRMPVARLQQIKIRIEVERAAAARKTP